MRTTIVMLSVDEAPLLEHSLPAAVAQAGAEVLVVDNAGEDRTPDVAAEHGARYMRLRERRSYCAAVNAGIAGSDGAAVLLLNADCVLAPGFLAAATARLRDPDVGSVVPKLIRAASVEPGARLDVLDTAGMTIDRRRKNGLVGHNAPQDAYAARAETFGGDGAAVLYRRATLEACAVGGEVLDEDFELWAADADLAWRAQLLGWRAVYEPAAVAWHVRYYSPSTRSALDPSHRRLQFRNRYLMIAKNETAAGLARDLHRILAYEILALGHVLLRERHLLGGYRDALRLLPGARRRRALIAPARARGRRVPFGLRPPS
ncbi:MAG: glycosyltransferase family 2 protein [Solirubrobacteraceae bacterium]